MRRLFPLLLYFCLCIGSLAGLLTTLAEAARVLPNAMELSGSPLNLSFEESEQIADRSARNEIIHAAASARRTSLFSGGSTQMPVAVNYTTDNYSEYISLPICSGSYFVSSPVREENQFAVIGDALAAKCFFTADCIGQTLLLDGVEYTVCGVYRTEQSFRFQASSDGLPEIYVSYAAVQQIKPERIFFRSRAIRFPASLEESVVASLGGRELSLVRMADHAETRTVLFQFLRLLVFYAGLLIALFLLRGLFRRIPILYQSIRGGERSAIIRDTLWCIGIILLVTGIFFTVKFQFILPQGWIPSDNLFDFQFYMQKIISEIRAFHSEANDFLRGYSLLASLSTAFWTLLCAIFLTRIAWQIQKRVFK